MTAAKTSYRRGSREGAAHLADNSMSARFAHRHTTAAASLSATLASKQDAKPKDERVPVSSAQKHLWESLCTIAVEVSPSLFAYPAGEAPPDIGGGFMAQQLLNPTATQR